MGQFNNVELFDEISEIPEHIALNDKAIELLYQFMVMEQEVAHKNYLQVFKEHPLLLKMFPEILDVLDESLLAVKQQKARTFEEFMQEINPK